MENRPWVHVELQNGGEAFEEKNEAHYLQPAGGGAAAASGYDDEEKDKFSKGRPLVEVGGYEAGGGGQGGRLEKGFPEGLIWNFAYVRECGTEVCRIYTHKPGIDIHRRIHWMEFYRFMSSEMLKLEKAFRQVKEAIE